MEKTSLPQGVILLTPDQVRSRFANSDIRIDVSKLGQAKRGDYLRLAIEWPAEPKPASEFITAMVKDASPQLQQAGLLKIRILSKPEHPEKHSLHYGDDLTIQQSWVLEHAPADNDEQRQRTAYLLEDMKPITPQPGKPYWTRNGSIAVIWTTLTDTEGGYLLGECSGMRDVQWSLNGTHRGTPIRAQDPGLDIVKDPSASELTTK